MGWPRSSPPSRSARPAGGPSIWSADRRPTGIGTDRRTGKHQPHDQSKHEPRRSHERTTAPHTHQPGPAAARRARRKSLENRIADQITRFAGSMQFVYLHVIWFAAWIILGSSTTLRAADHDRVGGGDLFVNLRHDQ